MSSMLFEGGDESAINTVVGVMMLWPVVVIILLVALMLICWYYRIDTFLLALVSLLDLLFSVKRRAKFVQTKNLEWTMADTIEECCSKYWDREFVIMAGGYNNNKQSSSWGKSRMTYGEAEMASSAVAKFITTSTHMNIHSSPRSANTNNNNDDDDVVVAIFMPSSCEFVVALFGLIRCGVRAALVNTGLRGNSLLHALTSALAEEGGDGSSSSDNAAVVRIILVSPDLKPVLESMKEAGQWPSNLVIVECGIGCELDCWTETKRFAYLEGDGRSRQKQNNKNNKAPPRWDDTCLYIYTSGTTGLPKASKMNHMRIWSAGCVTRKVCRLNSSDRLYCPLPLYHSSGLTLGLGACLQRGCATVIRPKFSVRYFSRDVITHRCTGVQYIGEMARYLVAAPSNTLDSQIRLRFAYGNGMPSEIWKTFKRRYNIGLINEFYASTEGNVNIFNNTGMAAGACGIVPIGCGWIYPIGIFKYDMDTGELIRNEKTGLCIAASPNEPGELLGLIKQNDPSRRFDGYTDSAATRSKVVDNVCKHGDTYFRSGDLLRQDCFGFLYFCDRVGETFRWKGENVSTSEVARALLECVGDNDVKATGTTNVVDRQAWFSEAVVYGVEVAGHPGRAGMAAAVLRRTDDDDDDDSKFMWQDPLWHSLQFELPRYAQPLFIRVVKEIEKTETQKYKKKKLQDESFLNCGTDDIYFRDDSMKTFVLMNDTIKNEVLVGKRRV
ncbi:MAG: acyl-CoA synthetase (AMP-forming)/AMP-acid ligase II [Bacillariaceae sp.]|jgi:acyl-CoA synthetase (AMP-forming)/AMP-acid ligase II